MSDQEQPVPYSKFVLHHFPDESFPKDLSCFQKVQATYNPADVKQGMASIRVRYITIDPMLRVWISGAKTYFDALVPGSTIPGFGIGRVIKIVDNSNRMNKPEQGDWVFGTLQWSQLMITSIKLIQKVPVEVQKLYKLLTVYGPSGLTSYLAIKEQILPLKVYKKLGSNEQKQRSQIKILISSAAGGIGAHLIEYLLKLGYREIYGIAGNDQKCQFVRNLGAKDCINYKKYLVNDDYESFAKHIVQMMGGKADIYFDNIGQDMLTTAILCLGMNSKVILCGATATYNNWKSKSGIYNQEMIITKRIQFKGILYYQYSEGKKIMAVMQMIELDIQGSQTVVLGMDNLPLVTREVFNGLHMGKPIVEFAYKWD